MRDTEKFVDAKWGPRKLPVKTKLAVHVCSYRDALIEAVGLLERVLVTRAAVGSIELEIETFFEGRDERT